MVCGPRDSDSRPNLRDDPVLADERHDVGKRAERRNLDEPRQPLALPRPRAQRLHELQRHANAGEVLVGVGAIVPLGIDHGDRVRQRALGLVMVGDDEVDPQLSRPLGRVVPADAAVDRHDDVDLVGMESIDRRRLESVAVPQAFGDEVNHLPAEHLERPPQDDGRGDAVDVVVAVDRNPLAVRERPLEPRHGAVHVRQQKRVVEVVERRVEKAIGHGRLAKPAQAEQAGDGRVDVQRDGERRGFVFVTRQVLPQARLHRSHAPPARGPNEPPARRVVRVANGEACPSRPMRLNLS